MLTVLGTLLVLAAVVFFGLFAYDKKNYPAPGDLDLSFLLALGIGVLLVLYVPWQRIRIAGFEMERAVQEQAEDFSREIARLRKENAEFRNKILDLELPQNEQRQKRPDIVSEGQEKEALILKFLKKSSSWGFTPLRIKNLGGNKSGYEELGDLSTNRLREILTNLVSDGKVRIRVSSNGNTLYQAR